jgi:gliding motility-associated protein GldL
MAQSKNRMKIMNMVYGLGAAVVIIGALFKIMHWPYGNLMLIIGLITEAF